MDWQPALAILIGVLWYGMGVHRLWRSAGTSRGISRGRVAAFASGILALVIALGPPLDGMSEQLFSAHMGQHLLLAVVAPPLLVLGLPGTAILWGLPGGLRRRWSAVLAGPGWHRTAWRTLVDPRGSWLVHAVAIWSWHLPSWYRAALVHPALHAAEHLSFFGTGVLLWTGIIGSHQRRRGPLGLGLLAVFLTLMQSGALGALLTVSSHAWYPIHAGGVTRWGLSLLEDQQLAGLLMWVVGGLLYLVLLAGLFLRWIEPSERRPIARLNRVWPAVGSVFALGLGSTSCRAAGADMVFVPGGDASRGRSSIRGLGCGSCHEIPGVTGAHGVVGPPLAGIARRSMIAGEIPNTPENMMRWLENPQAVEPHTAMPNLNVTGETARDMAAYLYTLR